VDRAQHPPTLAAPAAVTPNLAWPAVASAVSAIIDWIGVATRRARIEYGAKPAAILFLIVWILLAVPPATAWKLPCVLVLAALALSLVGDILLMLPSAQFIAGLVVFLLAHLAYILAFNWGRGFPGAAQGLVAAGVAIVLVLILSPVRAGLRRAGRAVLVVPVAAYAITLGAMLWSALGALLQPSWLAHGAWWIAFGGLAFFASDVSLVWDRFVGPIPGRRVTTHMLYHAAQLALTGGVLVSLAG
jgi:uncharacterized membrane protein YhhN